MGARSLAISAKFYADVARAGAEILEPRRLGVDKPHRVRCAAGHLCTPRPTNGYTCRACGPMAGNQFYVVRNPVHRYVKFGVTSNLRRRLREHDKEGLTEVVLTFEMSGAVQLEDRVRGVLARAGMTPRFGFEYFDISALPIILDVVDNYPTEEIAS